MPNVKTDRFKDILAFALLFILAYWVAGWVVNALDVTAGKLGFVSTLWMFPEMLKTWGLTIGNFVHVALATFFAGLVGKWFKLFQ